jgi:Domain of unknown function (DUF1707)
VSAPDILVSDAEREVAVDRLRQAAGEGRLAQDELEERVSRAFSARTQSELDALLVDLPPGAGGAAVGVGDRVTRGLVLRRQAAGFLTPNLVCITVWAATGAGSFWPIWVLAGTGIGFGTFLIRHLLGIDEDDDDRLPPPPGLPRLPRL